MTEEQKKKYRVYAYLESGVCFDTDSEDEAERFGIAKRMIADMLASGDPVSITVEAEENEDDE